MGRMLYGDSGIEIVFDDRALAHLQLVISRKLRRGESMFFTWRDDPAAGDGRSSIWLDHDIPLLFQFASVERHVLNTDWLDALTASANSGAGLVLSDEPGAVDTATPRPASTVGSSHSLRQRP
ncbi:MAG: ATP-dependent ligase [Glaciihabitans sp.]|jgi:hypothetical protein|nr:ATP-dependent ligase [Glaciihabitans sp.]MDQ1571279.1 hypothetical protein [Actinomycetota bacterium]